MFCPRKREKAPIFEFRVLSNWVFRFFVPKLGAVPIKATLFLRIILNALKLLKKLMNGLYELLEGEGIRFSGNF